MQNLALSFMEVLAERVTLDNQARANLKALEKGKQGEDAFRERVKELLPEGWLMLCDLKLPTSASYCQIDALVIAPHCVYVFEVKNYQAKYQYDEGRLASQSGLSPIRDPFGQIQRAVTVVKDALSYQIPVTGRVVYMQEYDTVDFQGQRSGEYLKRWQLQDFFEKEAEMAMYRFDPESVRSVLLVQQIQDYHCINYQGLALRPQARTGILCEGCLSGAVRRNSRVHIACERCGKLEALERAVVRTIYDYGVLYYQDELKIQPVHAFVGQDVNLHTLRTILKKHFVVHNHNKSSYYENPRTRFTYLAKDYHFKYDV